MTFTKNFAFEICFLHERRVLLQTKLLFLYYKRVVKLASYLFNQEKGLLNGGL